MNDVRHIGRASSTENNLIRSSRSWRGVHADESSSLLRSHLTTLETELQLRSMHRKFRVMSADFKGTRRSINTSWTEKRVVRVFQRLRQFLSLFFRISSFEERLINRWINSRREKLNEIFLRIPFPHKNSSRNRRFALLQSFPSFIVIFIAVSLPSNYRRRPDKCEVRSSRIRPDFGRSAVFRPQTERRIAAPQIVSSRVLCY